MDSREHVKAVRDDMAIYRNNDYTLAEQISARERATFMTLDFVANMGHADNITAQRMAKIVLGR